MQFHVVILCQVLDCVRNLLFTLFMLYITLQSRCSYFHCTDEEPEAQGG